MEYWATEYLQSKEAGWLQDTSRRAAIAARPYVNTAAIMATLVQPRGGLAEDKLFATKLLNDRRNQIAYNMPIEIPGAIKTSWAIDYLNKD